MSLHTHPVPIGIALAMLLAIGAPAAPARGLPAAVDGTPLPTLAPMLERVGPTVVNISTRSRIRYEESPLLSDPMFRWFFDLPQQAERETSSLGSGVIVDAAKGYVLTNHHVIKAAQEITVTLEDGRKLPAHLVGSDPETDIALLRIKAQGLKAIELGDSDGLRVGDFVVAIDSPFGLSHTVTSGIVSALGRTGLGIEGYESFIQTDASINPGNSGGPLVNLHGQLVGINTAILAPEGGNIGISFAIPVSMVRPVMEQLARYGEVRRGSFGVQAQDLTPESPRRSGTPPCKTGPGRSPSGVVSPPPREQSPVAGRRSAHPHPGVAEQAHPGPVLTPAIRMPGVLHGAEHPLWMGHHDGDAAVLGGESGDAPRGAVGIGRVAQGRGAVVLQEAQHRKGPQALQVRGLTRLHPPLSVSHGDGHA
jgi:S1-C subfamily serine protease